MELRVWSGGNAPLPAALISALPAHGVTATLLPRLDGLAELPAPGRRKPGPGLVLTVFDGATATSESHVQQLLQASDAVLAALDSGRIGRLLLVSSTSVYGELPAGIPLTEDAPLSGSTTPFVARARAAEERFSAHPGVVTVRAAHLLGPGCAGGILARQLHGSRLLVVRGTSPVWQVCHTDDLAAAIALLAKLPATELPARPVVVASAGTLTQPELERVSGRGRLELPRRMAEATAARLQRTGLSPGAADELPYLSAPAVVEAAALATRGWTPAWDAAGAVRAHTQDETRGVSAQTVLAGATVAAVGTAALVRRARRARRGR